MRPAKCRTSFGNFIDPAGIRTRRKLGSQLAVTLALSFYKSTDVSKLRPLKLSTNLDRSQPESTVVFGDSLATTPFAPTTPRAPMVPPFCRGQGRWGHFLRAGTGPQPGRRPPSGGSPRISFSHPRRAEGASPCLPQTLRRRRLGWLFWRQTMSVYVRMLTELRQVER